MGYRKRYRRIDAEALLQSADFSSIKESQKRYKTALDRLIRERDLFRQACWKDSMAVGSKAVVKREGGRLKDWKEVNFGQSETDPKIHMIRDPAGAGYLCPAKRFLTLKIASKGRFRWVN